MSADLFTYSVMLNWLTATYVQFVTKVKEQQCLHWPVAGWRGFQGFEAPSFIDIRASMWSVCHLYVQFPRKYFRYSFVSGAELTPGTLCSLLDCVIEEF
jgi:hypothetical protein